MKVLLITKSFPPLLTARSLQISRVADAIAKNDVDLKVIAGLNENIHNYWDYKNSKLYDVYYINYDDEKFKINIFNSIFNKFEKDIFNYIRLSDWAKKSIYKIESIFEEFKPDVIFTSSHPFEVHTIGLYLKKKYHFKWLASFSDPWPPSICPKPYRGKLIPGIKYLHNRILKEVLKYCDAIHFTNKYVIELLEDKVQVNIKDKSHIIPHIISNGENYDSKYKGNGWLAHIGVIDRPRINMNLLKAIKIVRDEIPDKFKGLLCVGRVDKKFLKMIKNNHLEDCVKCIGIVSPDNAFEHMKESTALLIIEADMPYSPFLPSKLFDYVKLNKPIIAITPVISAIRDYSQIYKVIYPVIDELAGISNLIKYIFTNNEFEKRYGINENNDSDVKSVSRKYLDLFNLL